MSASPRVGANFDCGRDGGEDGIAVLCVQANFGGDSVSLISWNRTADENTES